MTDGNRPPSSIMGDVDENGAAAPPSWMDTNAVRGQILRGHPPEHEDTFLPGVKGFQIRQDAHLSWWQCIRWRMRFVASSKRGFPWAMTTHRHFYDHMEDANAAGRLVNI